MEGIWYLVLNVFPGNRLEVRVLSYLLEKRKKIKKMKLLNLFPYVKTITFFKKGCSTEPSTIIYMLDM